MYLVLLFLIALSAGISSVNGASSSSSLLKRRPRIVPRRINFDRTTRNTGIICPSTPHHLCNHHLFTTTQYKADKDGVIMAAPVKTSTTTLGTNSLHSSTTTLLYTANQHTIHINVECRRNSYHGYAVMMMMMSEKMTMDGDNTNQSHLVQIKPERVKWITQSVMKDASIVQVYWAKSEFVQAVSTETGWSEQIVREAINSGGIYTGDHVIYVDDESTICAFFKGDQLLFYYQMIGFNL